MHKLEGGNAISARSLEGTSRTRLSQIYWAVEEETYVLGAGSVSRDIEHTLGLVGSKLASNLSPECNVDRRLALSA